MLNVSEILKRKEEMNNLFPALCSASSEEVFSLLASLVSAREAEDLLKAMQEVTPKYVFPKKAPSTRIKHNRVAIVRGTEEKVYPVGRPPLKPEYFYVSTREAAYRALGRKM